MSILDWKKDKEQRRKEIINKLGGEEAMKFAKGYKDRYGIIKEMGEKCDKWKNIDYSVASSKILDAEVELEVECAFEKTRFDKPKKWYKEEDAHRIEELLLAKEIKDKQISVERGATRTEINEQMQKEYGFIINAKTFTRLEEELGLNLVWVDSRHGGRKAIKYINEDYDKLMSAIDNEIIPKKQRAKKTEVKVYNIYDDEYSYIENKINELKNRIAELENQVKERDQIIEDLRSKSVESAFDRIKKMFD